MTLIRYDRCPRCGKGCEVHEMDREPIPVFVCDCKPVDSLRSTFAIREKKISDALAALGYAAPVDGKTSMIDALDMIVNALEDLLAKRRLEWAEIDESPPCART